MKSSDIRRIITSKYQNKEFVIDKTGQKTVEIIGASFEADEESIFGKPNYDYIKAEIDWYNSQSLNVNDIYVDKEPPKAWKAAATDSGVINSNYGWLIFNHENFSQYKHVCDELKQNRDSRRAVMIYTRPSIWYEYDLEGMSDFICTNAVSYLIRDNALNAVVQMRSNDIVFGYRNDREWQKYVLDKLAKDLNVEVGKIHWQVQSLHIYERHFDMIEKYLYEGDWQ